MWTCLQPSVSSKYDKEPQKRTCCVVHGCSRRQSTPFSLREPQMNGPRFDCALFTHNASRCHWRGLIKSWLWSTHQLGNSDYLCYGLWFALPPRLKPDNKCGDWRCDCYTRRNDTSISQCCEKPLSPFHSPSLWQYALDKHMFWSLTNSFHAFLQHVTIRTRLHVHRPTCTHFVQATLQVVRSLSDLVALDQDSQVIIQHSFDILI